jgi:hypothetical protein
MGFLNREIFSVADPGCLSRIRIFSIPVRIFSIPVRIFPSRIQIFPNPDTGSASRNLSILTKKLFLNSRKYDPGCSFRILILYPSRIPNPGVKKAPDPGSGSATLEIYIYKNSVIINTVPVLSHPSPPRWSRKQRASRQATRSVKIKYKHSAAWHI